MVEVGVISGEALHPLVKQEQHHTRVVPAGFQYLHWLRLPTFPGQQIQNWSELSVSSVTWTRENYRNWEGIPAWRLLTELFVSSKERKGGMEIIEGVYLDT